MSDSTDELDELLALLSDEEEEEEKKGDNSARRTALLPSKSAILSRLKNEEDERPSIDPCLASKHSSIRVCDRFERKLSQVELDTRLQSWKVLSMGQLQRMSGADSIKRGQFALIAVVARKTLRESAKGTAYLRIILTDLRLHQVNVLAFDDSVITLFSKVTEGSVIALAGAPLMEDRAPSASYPRSSSSRFGASSMHGRQSTLPTIRLFRPSQVLLVGLSKDFGYCKKLSQNMERCREPIDLREREYCLFHSRQGYEKAAQRRNDSNQRSVRTLGTHSRSKDLRKKMAGLGVTMTRPVSGSATLSRNRSGLSRGATAHFPCSMLRALSSDPSSFSSSSSSLSVRQSSTSKRMTLGQRMIQQARQDSLAEGKTAETRGKRRTKKRKSDVNDDHKPSKQKRVVLGDITLKRQNTAPLLGRGLNSGNIIGRGSRSSSVVLIDDPSAMRGCSDQVSSSSLQRTRVLSSTKIIKQKPLACDRQILERNRDIHNAAAILNRSQIKKKKRQKRSLSVSEGTDDKENEHPSVDDDADDADGEPKKHRRRRLAQLIEMDADKKAEIMQLKSMNPESNLEWMDYLSFKEQESEKLSEITSVKISVYVCTLTSCPGFSKRREFPNAFCKQDHPHLIAKKHDGRKYFFECEKCKSKQCSVDRKILRTKCAKCGESKFKACSAYHIWEPKTEPIKPTLMITNNRAELRSSMMRV